MPLHWALFLNPALLRLYQTPIVDIWLIITSSFLRMVPTNAYMKWLCPYYLALYLGHADPSLDNQNTSPWFFRLYYAKGLHTFLMVQKTQWLFVAIFSSIWGYIVQYFPEKCNQVLKILLALNKFLFVLYL